MAAVTEDSLVHCRRLLHLELTRDRSVTHRAQRRRRIRHQRVLERASGVATMRVWLDLVRG